ncbi:MAG: carboxylesterase family protein [Flavobacterium sp.]|uniref:carboxylesterase/lipase family protein n=1 Tax=Flavobacterium sp. TaxID=239 RepID=UPI002733A470|nr:carboxylesterase family protein [Flavobacterium sp.]MDP3681873.1 carboxylesterase family protein [Flavobacterium sp.]MDZ4329870.1 carboxylesterase family protein [Flavobacterium sp.]
MNLKTNCIGILLLLIPFFSEAQQAENQNAFPVQLTIANGTIEGEFDIKTNIQSFKGIPFAQPPVGDLRWKAPQPLTNWTGVKQTKKFGPRAIQSNVFGDMGFRSDGMSEDCLYLNVWSPAKSANEKLPVLVYFYGGGFAAGDGSESRYDGENMAKKGIVTLTVNYRLGIWGFFSHPELTKESPNRASGNYGLLDQNAALKWVQANISKFGGDPKRVTIAGESAGSIAVSAQMASPLSKGLIAGAIGESGGSIFPTLAPVPLAEAEKTGLEYAQKIGATSLKNLREMSTLELYQKSLGSSLGVFKTTIDGYFLTKTLPETFEAKQQAMIPLLLGWNSEEMTYRALTAGKDISNETYIQKVKELYGKKADEVLKLYPTGTLEVTEQSATDLSGDRFIAYSTWKWFDLHRKNSTQPVYRYYYTHPRPEMRDNSLEAGLAGGVIKKNSNTPKAPIPKGAVHSAEIEYAMGNLAGNKDYAWTESDYAVSETMLNYFANFIKTGNPNGDKLPVWPMSKNEEKPEIMIIDLASKSVRAENDARYLFLDKEYSKK